MPNGIMDGFFHRRIKTTSYHFKKKRFTKRYTSDDARPPGHRFFERQNLSVKNLSKNTIFIYKKKNAGTDVVTGKYIEEAQPLKLQPA